MLSNWRIDSKSPMPTNLLASHVLVRLGVNGVTGASHISEKCLKRKSLYTPIYYIIIIYIYIYTYISNVYTINVPGKFALMVQTETCCLAVIQHYGDVIMGPMVSVVYSTVCSGGGGGCGGGGGGGDQRKHQSSASLAFVRRIHRWPQRASNADFFPFDAVIMSGISYWYPLMYSSLCNSFHEQVPVDFNCGHLIFKRIAVIRQKEYHDSSVSNDH